MIEPLEALRNRINESIEAATAFLASGRVEDMIEYAKITGRISALREANAEILEIERRYAED